MKVCKYCGAVAEDHAKSCSSCGGSAFKYRCENCGTVFEDGMYCPKCGVKAGRKPKKCPRCGAEYYSTACPECGFLPGQNQAPPPVPNPNPNPNPNPYAYQPARPNYVPGQVPVQSSPPKKRKTWLWVLGWIFIFPVPLTMLIWRNNKMHRPLKIFLIIISWALYIGMVSTNESKNTSGVTSTKTQITTQDNYTKKTASFPTTETSIVTMPSSSQP